MKSALRSSAIIAFLATALTIPVAPAIADGKPRAVLDPTFGHRGVLDLDREEVYEVHGATTSDGGLLVGSGPTIHVLGGNGGVGAAFGATGASGLAAIPPALGDDFAIDDFTVDPQGRLLVLGSSLLPESENPTAEAEYGEPAFSPSVLRVIRLLPDGDLDPEFGSAGVVETDLGISPPLDPEGSPLGTHPALTGTGIAVDPQGRIVITGSAIVGFRPSCAHDDYQPISVSTSFFLRLGEDGTPDRTFGREGISGGHPPEPVDDLLSNRLEGQPLSEDPLGAEVIGDPVTGPDGRITYRTTGSLFCVLENIHAGVGRLTAEGGADRSFGQNGALRGFYEDIAAAPDGSVVALTYPRGLREENPVKAELLRFGPDGKIDPSFGDGGRTEIRFGADTYVGLDSVAIDPEGRILVGGLLEGSKAATSVVLLRYTADGRREERFGPHGRVATRIGNLEGLGELLFDPQGRLLSVGDYREEGYEGLFVARYLLR